MTKRENQVLQLILRGMTNKQICVELQIAEGTVKTHLQMLFREFGVSTRLELALKAVEAGHRANATRRYVMGVQV